MRQRDEATAKIAQLEEQAANTVKLDNIKAERDSSISEFNRVQNLLAETEEREEVRRSSQKWK